MSLPGSCVLPLMVKANILSAPPCSTTHMVFPSDQMPSCRVIPAAARESKVLLASQLLSLIL